MIEERWHHIHEVFQAALDLCAAERAAYLDAVCTGDAELRREVESLLAASAESGHFDRLAERFEVQYAEDKAMPAHIGPYRLLRELGRGGMGTVYLAVREDDQLKQAVALKVFHAGAQRPDLVERFLAERQILAQLDHPHIARLFFGGVTEPVPGAQGRQPYFAMEYVKGEPLTDYCDVHHLGINVRLRLFLNVCEAVQHAHRHLVVHRDLKPTNILVTEDGIVKLLDFGIAKLLDEALILNTVPLTQTGLRLMTPEYASPEQVRGEAVTTATDVYQLGVLLYELLTGRRPYCLPSRLLHEVERIICEEPPEKPSTAVTRIEARELDDERAAVTGPELASRVRATTVEHLRRRLSGDLDTIVLMAMRKEPERRYVSAEALAEDLRLHLEGLPVRARPDTLGYRAAKFARRHRFGVAATALIALLVAGFAVTMAIQARRVAQERDRAEEATAFVIDLFEDFSPEQAQGSTVTTRDLLDRRAARIQTGLRDQPILQARLLDALGEIYQLRGHFPEAESLLREGLALRLEHLAANHLDVAESRHHLGILLSEKDDYKGAEPLLREALATYRRVLGSEHPRVSYVLDELATLHRTRGDLDGAETLYRELLETYRPGESDIDRAIALLFLGKIHVEKGHFDEAERLLETSLAIRRKLFGEAHPGVANSLDGLGELMQARGDYPAAERIYREAYVIRQRVFEEAHPDRAASLTKLGSILYDQGRYVEAEPLLHNAIAIIRPAFGEQNNLVTEALYYMGSIRLARQDVRGADSLLTAALAIWERHLPDIEHPILARTLDRLGQMRLQVGDTEAADSLLQQASAMRRALEEMQGNRR